MPRFVKGSKEAKEWGDKMRQLRKHKILGKGGGAPSGTTQTQEFEQQEQQQQQQIDPQEVAIQLHPEPPQSRDEIRRFLDTHPRFHSFVRENPHLIQTLPQILAGDTSLHNIHMLPGIGRETANRFLRNLRMPELTAREYDVINAQADRDYQRRRQEDIELQRRRERDMENQMLRHERQQMQHEDRRSGMYEEYRLNQERQLRQQQESERSRPRRNNRK